MRVVVAMSGGVDSSVSALLLREAGHEVTGVFLRSGVAEPAQGAGAPRGCCSARDACDAEEVAAELGIPFYALDHSAQFEQIVERFVAEYAAGRTPNPCVDCNRTVKLGELLRFATAVGAEAVATGHYARCRRRDGEIVLRRGRDVAKDQSYVLATVRREALARALFPIGGLPKEEVRERAARAGLPVHDKPDSQEICFVPEGDHRVLLEQRRPELFRPGRIRDAGGRLLGRHDGAAGFTVGQRHGLGVGGSGPWYVTRVDPVHNEVIVGRREEVLSTQASAAPVSWVVPEPTEAGERLGLLQVRAHGKPHPVRARWSTTERIEFSLEEGGEMFAPGQIAVLYDGERVVAAGPLCGN